MLKNGLNSMPTIFCGRYYKTFYPIDDYLECRRWSQ